jgi:hypothetical protein
LKESILQTKDFRPLTRQIQQKTALNCESRAKDDIDFDSDSEPDSGASRLVRGAFATVRSERVGGEPRREAP